LQKWLAVNTRYVPTISSLPIALCTWFNRPRAGLRGSHNRLTFSIAQGNKGGRGGGRGARAGGKGDRSGGAHRPYQTYPEVKKENERLERFYNGLLVDLSEEEKVEFWAALRRELPNSFRFCGSKGYVCFNCFSFCA